MITRKEILEQYDVNELGIITSPGKFEAEMLYVPHFYEVMMLGEAEQINDEFVFDLESEDIEQFPEILSETDDYHWKYEVRLHESNQGFVNCVIARKQV